MASIPTGGSPGGSGFPRLFFDDEEERERREIDPEELCGIKADVFGRVVRRGGVSKAGGGGGDNTERTFSSLSSSTSSSSSFREDEIAASDVGGANVEKLLSEMDAALERIPPERKGAYLDALVRCPDELCPDRRRAFLLREDGDPFAAAERLVRYWDRRRELFGGGSSGSDGGRCYGPSTIEGMLGDDDVLALSDEYYTAPPNARDEAGRAIFVAYLGRRDMSVPREPILRAVWYLFHCMLEDPRVQKRGIILLINCTGAGFGKFDPVLASSIIGLEKLCLPVRFRAQHVCHPPSFIRAIKPVINGFLGRQMRMRHIVHGGGFDGGSALTTSREGETLLDELGRYGIPPGAVPRDMGGTLDFSPKLWLVERLEVERERRRLKREQRQSQQRQSQQRRDDTGGLDVLVTAAMLRLGGGQRGDDTAAIAEPRASVAVVDTEEKRDQPQEELNEVDDLQARRQVTKKKRGCVPAWGDSLTDGSLPLVVKGSDSVSTMSSPLRPEAASIGPISTLLHPAAQNSLAEDVQRQLATAAAASSVMSPAGVASISSAARGAPTGFTLTNSARTHLPRNGVQADTNGSASSGLGAEAVLWQRALEEAAHELVRGQRTNLLRAPSQSANAFGLRSMLRTPSAAAARTRPLPPPALNGIGSEVLRAFWARAGSADVGACSNPVPTPASALTGNAAQLLRAASNEPRLLGPSLAGNVGIVPPMASSGVAALGQQLENGTMGLGALLQLELQQQQQQQQSPFNGPDRLSDALVVNTTSLHTLPRQHRQADAPPRPQPQIPRAVEAPLLPRPLYVPSDDIKTSALQSLVRQQIEAFVASEDHVATHARGRCRPVVLGQVGIRCRHCRGLPLGFSPRGSIYFPSELVGIYQTAQKMTTLHLGSIETPCPSMPEEVREAFRNLSASKSTAGGGKNYWAEAGRAIGLVDSPNGIKVKG